MINFITLLFRLNTQGIPYRLCSNTSTKTKEDLCATLTSMGFDIKANQIFPPAPAACQILKKQGLRPHLLVSKGISLFSSPCFAIDHMFISL